MDGREQRIHVADLSAAGAYLETPSPLPPGNQIRLRIELSDEVLELAANLRWANGVGAAGAPVAARPRGMGVEFPYADASATTRIEAHLEQELARFLL